MIAAAAMSGLLAGSAARSIASVSVLPSNESGMKAKKVIADDAGKKDADKADKHDCKGKNDCKGKGGCKTSDNGCKGKNSCKGKGGCATNKEEKKDADKKLLAGAGTFAKTLADDAGKKDADKADKHDCKGKNDCKGKGGCKTERQRLQGQELLQGQGRLRHQQGREEGHGQEGCADPGVTDSPCRNLTARARPDASGLPARSFRRTYALPTASTASPTYGIGIGLRVPHYRHILEQEAERATGSRSSPKTTWSTAAVRWRCSTRSSSSTRSCSTASRCTSARPTASTASTSRRLKALVQRTQDAVPVRSSLLGQRRRHLHATTCSRCRTPSPPPKVTAERIRQARDYLEVPICVENVSSYAEFHGSEMTEWEFLTEVVERADCGILLDVNNIYVSSKNHNFDPYDYLNSVPHERVGQIHIAGHTKYEKYILDTHDHPVLDRRLADVRPRSSASAARPTRCWSGTRRSRRSRKSTPRPSRRESSSTSWPPAPITRPPSGRRSRKEWTRMRLRRREVSRAAKVAGGASPLRVRALIPSPLYSGERVRVRGRRASGAVNRPRQPREAPHPRPLAGSRLIRSRLPEYRGEGGRIRPSSGPRNGKHQSFDELRALQRLALKAITRPLAPGDRMQRTWDDGRPTARSSRRSSSPTTASPASSGWRSTTSSTGSASSTASTTTTPACRGPRRAQVQPPADRLPDPLPLALASPSATSAAGSSSSCARSRTGPRRTRRSPWTWPASSGPRSSRSTRRPSPP